MHNAPRMTERERIAYRLGFDDGLAAMRERIEDLLLENARLRKPILERRDHDAASWNLAGSPISGEDLASWLAQPGPLARFVERVSGGYSRDGMAAGNGSGRT